MDKQTYTFTPSTLSDAVKGALSGSVFLTDTCRHLVAVHLDTAAATLTDDNGVSAPLNAILYVEGYIRDLPQDDAGKARYDALRRTMSTVATEQGIKSSMVRNAQTGVYTWVPAALTEEEKATAQAKKLAGTKAAKDAKRKEEDATLLSNVQAVHTAELEQAQSKYDKLAATVVDMTVESVTGWILSSGNAIQVARALVAAMTVEEHAAFMDSIMPHAKPEQGKGKGARKVA